MDDDDGGHLDDAGELAAGSDDVEPFLHRATDTCSAAPACPSSTTPPRPSSWSSGLPALLAALDR